MFNSNTLMVIASVVAGFLAALILGKIFVPMLRALKAGQSIREEGPIWHNYKAGTPMMGGLMFILSGILCLLGNLFTIKDYTVFYVLLLSLSRSTDGITTVETLTAILSFVVVFSFTRFGFAHIEAKRAKKLEEEYDED